MKNIQHYYFKFQKRNKAFKKFVEEKEYKQIPLCVYFGKWRKKDYKKHEKDGGGQVKTFFDVNNSSDEHHFWIFFKGKIYNYKPTENKIIDDVKNELIDEGGSFAKCIECELVREYEKIKLPQVFSNINANQKYNRKTVVKLDGPEKKIADRLIDDKHIKINGKNFLNYLSPIEFETLCFLIFNVGKSHCSSFRGGTLAKYDLRVKNNNQYEDLEDKFWLQVKKKEIKNISLDKEMYLCHLGDTDIKKNIIGKQWILKAIKKESEIKRWLEELFKEYENIFELDNTFFTNS